MGIVMFGVWLLWSGHYSLDHTLVLVLGLVSCGAVAAIAHRMGIVNSEGHPIQLLGKALIYGVWLLWAILKANIDVAKRILNPNLPISPTLVRVQASQKSDLGKVIYANSITLTPGTVTIEVEDNIFTVHAISKEGAEEVEAGDMDGRVSSMEGLS